MDPTTAARTIGAQLEQDIRRGRLPAGAVLHQVQLAERFAVSRQPIRLAIEGLRAAGLVVARRDRSVEVSRVPAEAVAQLLAVRRLVEREAIALALPRLGPRDLLAARQIQERLEIETDAKALEELDCAFHAALYQACGNHRLLQLIDDLRREDLRAYRQQPIGSSQRDRLRREHRGLLARCAAGDIAGAIAALDRHLGKPERT